jgi:hypothetical protein
MKPDTLEQFWRDFDSETEGGKKPAILDLSCFTNPIFSAQDGMELAREIFAEGALAVNVDGSLRKAARLLSPPASVEEYPDFVDRFAAANGSGTITFTRDYCLKYSPVLAHRFRLFLHKYVSARGIPVPGVNAVFIGGRYRATWIGLHNDFCATFLMPAIGRKRMLLWPPPYFQDVPLLREPSLNGICYGHVDLDPYRADARLFEVREGEALFIPETWWHYNDLPRAELTMTLSLGIFDNARVSDLVQRSMLSALAVETSDWSHLPMPVVPAGIFNADLTNVHVDHRAERIIDQARYMLRVQALIASSSGGILGCRAFRKAPDDLLESCLLGREHSPVFMIVDAIPCLLVAGGVMRTVPDSPELRQFIDQVNSYAPFLVRDGCSEKMSIDEALVNIASWLYSLGCLEIAEDFLEPSRLKNRT